MAQFFKRTEIVNDIGVYEVYPDLFTGQQTSITIEGSKRRRGALLEFKTAESNHFGGGKLVAIRPNFYISNVDLKNSQVLPMLKGYSLKKNLSVRPSKDVFYWARKQTWDSQGRSMSSRRL